ncbi:MAG: hypothetical protein H0W11_03050 [Gemmatimonadetes bacterium]|nr:hypothetical protein [Gemmatimonadota bacterium]
MPQTRNLYARRDEQAIHDMMLRLNSKAWGIALGLLLGTGLFVATNFLVLKGGDPVGPHLSLLGIYFPGYRVTFLGSLIGFVYAFVIGYGLGRLIGTVYNRMVGPTR